MKRILSTILLTIVSTIAFAQDGHITYTDQSNSKNFGRDVLVRSDAANLDTLTSVYAGSIAYDTTEKSIKVHDGSQWQPLSFGLTKDTSITIASAAVLTLNSSPVTIIPAQGAGTAIEVISAVVHVNFNTTAYDAGTLLILSSGSPGFYQLIANDVLTATTEIYSTFSAVQGIQLGNLIENESIAVIANVSNPNFGDSDIKVYLRYRLIEL